MKKDYPKMIYKGGVVSPNKEDYAIVQSAEEEALKLKEWSDLGLDKVAKKKKKADNSEVAEDSKPVEEKPRRKKKATKKAKKGVE